MQTHGSDDFFPRLLRAMLDKDSVTAMQYAVLWTTNVHRFMLCLRGEKPLVGDPTHGCLVGGSRVASNEPRAGMERWGSTLQSLFATGTAKQDPHHNLQKILNLLMSATKQQLMPSASQVRRARSAEPICSFFSFYVPNTKPKVLVLLVPGPSEDKGYPKILENSI